MGDNGCLHVQEQGNLSCPYAKRNTYCAGGEDEINHDQRTVNPGQSQPSPVQAVLRKLRVADTMVAPCGSVNNYYGYRSR